MGANVITAVDTSVLLDVFARDPKHVAHSLESLRRARSEGALVACPAVWAELRAYFGDATTLRTTLDEAGVRFDPFDVDCAELAGEYWRAYRANGGSRSRVITDFLIGAHAAARGGRLVSRDRGFFREYFSGLQIL